MKLYISIFIITTFVSACKSPEKISSRFYKNNIEKIKLRSISKSKIHLYDPSNADFIIKNKYNSTYSSVDILSKQKTSTSQKNLLKNPILISIMPKNTTEYTAIYKAKPTISIKHEIDKYNSMVINIEKSKIFRQRNKENLELLIKMSENEPIIIFGHSINKGKVLILPNGDKLSALKLHLKCKEYNKNCLVLTCDGKDFSIKGKISALDGLRIWEKSIEKMDEEMTTDDLIKTFGLYRSLMISKNNLYITFTATLGATSTYVLSSKYRMRSMNRKIIDINKLAKEGL